MTDSTLLDWDNLTEDDVRPEDRDNFRAMREFDRYIAEILAAHGGEIICPRCRKPTMGWPLRRADNCGGRPDEITYCIRDPQKILDDIARRSAKASRKAAA